MGFLERLLANYQIWYNKTMKLSKNQLISLLILTLLGLSLIIFYVNQQNFVIASETDSKRKRDINTIFYHLTEDYYQKNQYYPEFIKTSDLKGKLPLTDPQGKLINTPESDYKYKTYNCDSNNKCQNFILSTRLDLEDYYQKTN